MAKHKAARLFAYFLGGLVSMVLLRPVVGGALGFPDIFELDFQQSVKPSPERKGAPTPSQGLVPKESSPSTENLELEGPATLQRFEGALFRRTVLESRRASWSLYWIQPDGEQAGPIPWWLDRQGNGHALLQALLPMGEETLPNEKPPCIKLFQVLSLYFTERGEAYPITSQVWLVLPQRDGKSRLLPSGTGAWRAHSPLFVHRVVYQPYREAALRLAKLLEGSLPQKVVKELVHKQWPEVLLLGKPRPGSFPEGPTEQGVWTALR